MPLKLSFHSLFTDVDGEIRIKHVWSNLAALRPSYEIQAVKPRNKDLLLTGQSLNLGNIYKQTDVAFLPTGKSTFSTRGPPEPDGPQDRVHPPNEFERNAKKLTPRIRRELTCTRGTVPIINISFVAWGLLYHPYKVLLELIKIEELMISA